ncbi:MAG TPA: hypothetical protein VLC72_06260 [Nitrosopumilaceae archaeon]|nr:hypothetical protein [Nitrosopumilaceae archaeon]
MYNWEYDLSESGGPKHLNLIIFASGAIVALVAFLIFHPQISSINEESPILSNILFGPALVIGFLYGIRITERVMRPSEIRSPIKRSIVKILLFFFVIGGLFSSVSFAMNGGSLMPSSSILDDGLYQWIIDFVTSNGGATFLIISSITLMASATRRIVGLGGNINKFVTFIGTFIFFSMLSLSFTQSDPTNSQVYLYTFYQAGIIGGAFYEMNKLTRNLNSLEDFANGYL